MSDEGKYRGPERRHYEGWHLDKRFNLGHILTTALIAASVFSWGSKMETRMALIEQGATQREQRIERLQIEINSRLDIMDGKLDRLVERELQRNNGRAP